MSSETGLVIDARGARVPVRLDSAGRFEAVVDGRAYHESTFEDLKRTVQRAASRKRVKIAVPFTMISYGRGEALFRPGTATGIHSRTEAILVRWESGEADQLEGYQTIYRPMSGAEREEAARLLTEKQQAEKALREFLEPRRLRLRAAVSEAVDAALTAGESDGEGR